MDTVAQLRAFPHSKKLRKSGRQRASFLNRSSRVEEVAFCPPCSLGSSNKCTLVPALCRGLVLSLMYKEETLAIHADIVAAAIASQVSNSSDHDPNGYRPSDGSLLGRRPIRDSSNEGWLWRQ